LLLGREKTDSFLPEEAKAQGANVASQPEN